MIFMARLTEFLNQGTFLSLLCCVYNTQATILVYKNFDLEATKRQYVAVISTPF